MPRKRLFHLLAGFTLTAIASVGAADDTDIYINPGAGLPVGSEPMVMFSLDYRPNLGSTACNGTECDQLIAEGWLRPQGPYTFFDVLRAVLRRVMDPLEGVKVGLMLNHDNTQDCNGPNAVKCSNGGYIAMGFELFTLGDTNGAKAKFHGILDAMPTPGGGQSHSYQGKELFFELFRYLTGQEIYNGHNGWTDYFTDASQNLPLDARGYSWDTGIEQGPDYVTPIDPMSQCSSLYSVNMMFQVSNQEDGADAEMGRLVADGGLDGKFPDFPDVIRYLHDADLGNGRYGTVADLDDTQNLTSYFLVDPVFINTTTTEYAQAGGTGLPLPLSTDPEELTLTLQNIFQQVLSVSTTFVAASVPVNVFNRAELTDNVFLALFQVDENLRPAWVGNLKKLRLASNNGATFLVDSLGNPAVAADGRINFDALTYWTLGNQLPPADPDDFEIDGRDGRAVARGGSGQRVPGFLSGNPGLTNGVLGGRRIFFDAAAGTLEPLDVDLTTAQALAGDLGAVTDGEAAELIAYARGLDIDDLDRDGTIKEARSWIFGDPLHSRPLPLNYGAISGYTTSNPAIFLAVSSNDGHLRFIRNTTTGGAQSGEEVWSFIPRKALGAMKTLRANGVATPHPYTVDGSPVAYIEDRNANGSIDAGERAILVVGMRRGGKAYYALEITDPENPTLLWSIDDSGDFADIGNTFSTPRVGLVNSNSGPVPAFIFGGGYDFNKDTRGVVGTDDTQGASIYVVDALTGALIWKARGPNGTAAANEFVHPELVDSIPSTVTLGDTDGDLIIDRIVAGDSGGNVWRADLAGPDPNLWKLTLLARLGRHDSLGKNNDRRFFHRADLVQSEDENGLYDAVLIGSGDRADPLDLGGLVDNFFYMIKDRHVTPGSGVDSRISHATLGDVTDNCLQEGAACPVDLTHGWKLQLEDAGEKSLATPTTIAGTVLFTTFMPAGASAATRCAPDEGRGRLYAVGLQDARSVINYDTTDDDPNYEGEATTKADRTTDLRSPGIPAEVVSIPPNQILRPDLQIDTIDVTTRWRTFWFLEENSDL
jgi:type IV pilus assembly protein PilY1